LQAATDTAVGVAGLNHLSDLARLVRVVDPDFVRVRPEVDHLVAEARDLVEHRVAELHPSVIERDRDLHTWTVPNRRRPESAS
jgi:hypothetical protein